MPTPQRSWWALAARLPRLHARIAITGAIRGFFGERGFLEVETPSLQRSPGLEPHLRAFATRLDEPFEAGAQDLFLHTSPEYAMKKLLAGGLPRIFQIARVFRNGERAALHHPEFTMLEWYRAGAGYRDIMADCEALLRAVAAAVPHAARPPGGGFAHGGVESNPLGPWEYLSVAEAFARHAGIDLLATAPDPARPDTRALAAEAARIGVHSAPGDRWDDVFFRVFLARIEPQLGHPAPTVLYDWPASMAALARLKPDDPRLAERFELYLAGVELANAFGELTDVDEQRRRFEADLALRRALGREAYPIDEDFLAALAAGPRQSAGIALGLDRLVMLATGAAHIEDVLWAPVAAPFTRS